MIAARAGLNVLKMKNNTKSVFLQIPLILVRYIF